MGFKLAPAESPRKEAALIRVRLQIDNKSAAERSFGEGHFEEVVPFFQKKS